MIPHRLKCSYYNLEWDSISWNFLNWKCTIDIFDCTDRQQNSILLKTLPRLISWPPGCNSPGPEISFSQCRVPKTVSPFLPDTVRGMKNFFIKCFIMLLDNWFCYEDIQILHIQYVQKCKKYNIPIYCSACCTTYTFLQIGFSWYCIVKMLISTNHSPFFMTITYSFLFFMTRITFPLLSVRESSSKTYVLMKWIYFTTSKPHFLKCKHVKTVPVDCVHKCVFLCVLLLLRVILLLGCIHCWSRYKYCFAWFSILLVRFQICILLRF